MGNIVMPAARDLAVKALAFAEGYADAHIVEVGGNNLGDQVETFQRWNGGESGESWCDDFTAAVFYKGYAALANVPLTRGGILSVVSLVRAHYLEFSPSCDLTWEAAKKRGIARPHTYQPRPGDIVMYDIPVGGARKGYPHHTGIVLSGLTAVEGNTSSGAAGSQGDGQGVYRRTRQLSDVFGYIAMG